MEILCTRPNCPSPNNEYPDLDDSSKLRTVQQKFCTCCGMPLILGGRYLPTRLLGKGGFGAAFLARDRDIPGMRPCVVKQFMPSGDLSPKALEIARGLFEREAAVLGQLGYEHEQIPDLFAFFPLTASDPKTGKDDQFFYLVQQYIDGDNLEEELAVKGQFSEKEVRYVLEEMLKVLQFVHENGSIHRDIKPSNIMRDRKNRLYLLDFGAVKQVTTTGQTVSGGGRSTGIYTMGYAPSEQMNGSQVYPCTDLYALAATCLCLLTGKTPEDLYDPFHNAWNWQSFAPSISPQLSTVLKGMLQTAAKDRIQSAEEAFKQLNENTSTLGAPTTIQAPAPVPLPPPPSPVTPPPQSIQVNTPQLPSPVAPPRFSLLEMLSGAAFTGFEIGFGLLVLINLFKFSISPLLLGIAGLVAAILVFLQYSRTIEGKDLLILLGVTIVLMFIPALNRGEPLSMLLASVVLAAFFVAITAIFRIVYLTISRIL